MSFSNQTMRQPVKGKPHIALIGGWWRVSPMPKNNRVCIPGHFWYEAHQFIAKLNNAMTDEQKSKRINQKMI